ncbi:MAG: hypothetical protein AAB768_02550 [Patescibacteria group bacterium]
MNNLAQLLLTIVIITLTLLLVPVAIQAISILIEIRRMFKKVNEILGADKNITEAASQIRRFFKRGGKHLT